MDLTKDIIISLSFAAVGLSAYLGTSNLWTGLHSKGWDRRINLAYAAARLGFAIMVALITEAVWKAPSLPWTWRLGLYTFGAVCIGLGYTGVAVEQRKARRP